MIDCTVCGKIIAKEFRYCIVQSMQIIALTNRNEKRSMNFCVSVGEKGIRNTECRGYVVHRFDLKQFVLLLYIFIQGVTEVQVQN